MLVKDLKDTVEKLKPTYSLCSVGDLEYADRKITDRNTNVTIDVGQNLRNFSKYFGIPGSFLPKLNPSLEKDVVDHFLKKYEDSEVIIASRNGTMKNLYTPKTQIIPIDKMSEAISRVFDDKATIKDLQVEDGDFHVSVVTESVKVEPRPGDITNGGLKVGVTIGYAPYVASYMERLVCSNGMTAYEENGRLGLRGRTVDEIIVEMESLAQTVLNQSTPDYLQQWGHLATVDVKDPQQLIHRLCRDYGISSRIELKILDRIGNLEGATYYDVVNLITSMQHEEGLRQNQFDSLQNLGGQAIQASKGHRCNTCLHLL